MIYAISDLHGCYEEYQKLLDILPLGDADTLYALGDVIDRGDGENRCGSALLALRRGEPNASDFAKQKRLCTIRIIDKKRRFQRLF